MIRASSRGLNVEKVTITKEMKDEHEQAVQDSVHHDKWNSHAVAVVDQSGSMRKTDAENGVTRSDLVWLSLAIDYVGRRLRTGEATSQDYFTLICLGPDAKCLIKHHPFNWILYNEIIDILRTRHPLGEGNYLPAISLAKRMLLSNRKGKCLHQLVFLTDGAPSDKAPPGTGLGSQGYQIHAICRHIIAFGSRSSEEGLFYDEIQAFENEGNKSLLGSGVCRLETTSFLLLCNVKGFQYPIKIKSFPSLILIPPQPTPSN